jgi:hypothetical protein
MKCSLQHKIRGERGTRESRRRVERGGERREVRRRGEKRDGIPAHHATSRTTHRTQ